MTHNIIHGVQYTSNTGDSQHKTYELPAKGAQQSTPICNHGVTCRKWHLSPYRQPWAVLKKEQTLRLMRALGAAGAEPPGSGDGGGCPADVVPCSSDMSSLYALATGSPSCQRPYHSRRFSGGRQRTNRLGRRTRRTVRSWCAPVAPRLPSAGAGRSR